MTLRLRAEDEQDLAVISACLQDAVVRVGDMAWLPATRRFAIAFNRFRWEGEHGAGAGQRIACGLHFEGVRSARLQGFAQSDRERVLDLLAITAEGAAEPGVAIRLVFAGNAAIKLGADGIECYLADRGQPWGALRRPQHRTGGR